MPTTKNADDKERGNKFLSLNNILRMKNPHPRDYSLLRSENAIQREEFIPSLLHSLAR